MQSLYRLGFTTKASESRVINSVRATRTSLCSICKKLLIKSTPSSGEIRLSAIRLGAFLACKRASLLSLTGLSTCLTCSLHLATFLSPSRSNGALLRLTCVNNVSRTIVDSTYVRVVGVAGKAGCAAFPTARPGQDPSGRAPVSHRHGRTRRGDETVPGPARRGSALRAKRRLDALRRVVEDDAEREALAAADSAHAVAQSHAIGSPGAARRALPDGEDHAVALPRPTTSARDCIRGRCSVSTNSPPEKSRSGAERRIATWSGKTSAP